VAGGLLLVLAVVQPPPLTRVITGWPPPGWRLALCAGFPVESTC
jgi:competence protein ComEC